MKMKITIDSKVKEKYASMALQCFVVNLNKLKLQDAMKCIDKNKVAGICATIFDVNAIKDDLTFGLGKVGTEDLVYLIDKKSYPAGMAKGQSSSYLTSSDTKQLLVILSMPCGESSALGAELTNLGATVMYTSSLTIGAEIEINDELIDDRYRVIREKRLEEERLTWIEAKIERQAKKELRNEILDCFIKAQFGAYNYEIELGKKRKMLEMTPSYRRKVEQDSWKEHTAKFVQSLEERARKKVKLKPCATS
jgi:hypothetical protein